jgi:hypothetical protein
MNRFDLPPKYRSRSDWKDLQIAWNEEFSDLFELGIFEQDKKQGARKPGYGGSLFQFNSQKIMDRESDFEKESNSCRIVDWLVSSSGFHCSLSLHFWPLI